MMLKLPTTLAMQMTKSTILPGRPMPDFFVVVGVAKAAAVVTVKEGSLPGVVVEVEGSVEVTKVATGCCWRGSRGLSSVAASTLCVRRTTPNAMIISPLVCWRGICEELPPPTQTLLLLPLR